MGKDVPRFFSLPQSSKVSFKVPSSKSRRRKLKDGTSIPEEAIAPSQDYTDIFEINENNQSNIPKIYTPEQIYNYKSAWKRYEKGMELVQSGKVLKDDGTNDGTSKSNYKVLSSKAPLGYWSVKKKPDVDTTNINEILDITINTSFQHPVVDPENGSSTTETTSTGGIITRTYNYDAKIFNNTITSNVKTTMSLSGLPNFPNDINACRANVLVSVFPKEGIEINSIKGIFSWGISFAGEVWEDDPEAGIKTEQFVEWAGKSFSGSGNNAFMGGSFPESENTAFNYRHLFAATVKLKDQPFAINLNQTLTITEINFKPVDDNGNVDNGARAEELDIYPVNEMQVQSALN